MLRRVAFVVLTLGALVLMTAALYLAWAMGLTWMLVLLAWRRS